MKRYSLAMLFAVVTLLSIGLGLAVNLGEPYAYREGEDFVVVVPGVSPQTVALWAEFRQDCTEADPCRKVGSEVSYFLGIPCSKILFPLDVKLVKVGGMFGEREFSPEEY
jgi:hypothetical protein